MGETIDDLKIEKDEFQEKANELKEKRNNLHLKSKRLADDRDSLNSAIRSMRNSISQHKKDRDDLNENQKLILNLLNIREEEYWDWGSYIEN